MAQFKPKVISLNKRSGQTFGFFLRLEHGEPGHLVRCLEMGGPAEMAGMKDGDRIVRVNKTFVDDLPHSEVTRQPLKETLMTLKGAMFCPLIIYVIQGSSGAALGNFLAR